MLRGKSSSSRARAASTSSRGSSSSRGRGRGASSSSSKYIPSDNFNTYQEGARVRIRYADHTRDTFENAHATSTWSKQQKKQKLTNLGTGSNAMSLNSFEKERLENAAKREQRGQESAAFSSRGGRGASRGRHQNKSVRFASPPIQQPKESDTANFSTSTATNGVPSPSFSSSTIAPTSQIPFNSLAPTSNTAGASLFSTSTNGVDRNPFGGSPVPQAPPSNPFGSQMMSGQQQSSVFGAPSGLSFNTSTSNPFSSAAASSSGKTSIFGAPSGLSSNNATSNLFSVATTTSLGKRNAFGTTTSPSFPSNTPATNQFHSAQIQSKSNGASNSFSWATNEPQKLQEKRRSQNLSSQVGTTPSIPPFGNPLSVGKNKLAAEIDALLLKNGIIAPSWPTTAPGDPRQKGAVEAFWQTMKAYRAKVRTCLIRNGFLDDPDKPKKLSEAIDFRGTCEDMCPKFEKITRIVEHDVQSAEKEPSPDGQSYWPALHKMVKALARSAAGQDAPLPEDVRSPAALRRTLDYLIDTVLGTNDLPVVHGFLWDRTRAIRRDFVFQQSSMTSEELLDQVYCLEKITRFHVVALHQMSHGDVVAEDFSEQQEVEQLGKALLSLIHAYEDCMAQGIDCENEPEFRAYYVLFNSHNTGILEAVQDWGWKFLGKSDNIRAAVSLVETLQNIWDTQGPLRPHFATDIAQNAYHRFFSIIEGTKVSYTMACFAEIHLNKVRKAALKTILSSYRKQRDQTTDWTLEKLNMYLRFDNEDDVVTFGEAYGLHFDVFNNQICLSLDSEDSMADPVPQLKQPHSYKLVERKRGNYTLPEAIHRTVYEEETEENDSKSFFVPPAVSAIPEQSTRSRSPVVGTLPDPLDESLNDETASPETELNKPVIQQGQKDMTFMKNQPPPVWFSGHESTASAKDGKAANLIAFGERASGFDANKPVESTSVSENPPAMPQKVSSFQNQEPTSLSSGPLPSSTFGLSSVPSFGPSSGPTGSSPFFPAVPAGQTLEGFKTFLTPTSAPPFSTLGPGGNFPSYQATVPTPARMIDSTQSGSLSETPKESPLKRVEPVEPNANREHSNSNQSASLGQIASVASKPSKLRMASFAEWFALGQEGMIDQYTESVVERILMQTVRKYVADEKKRRLQEEEKLSREEATRFRSKFLGTKYFYRWREMAHRLWMKRKGRLARQVRRQMAEESFRASRAAANRDVVEEFRASGGARRQSMENNLVSTEKRTSSDEVATHTPKSPKKSSPSINGESPRPPRKTQNKSDDGLRKSLLSDSAYLQGGSRIHLLPNYSPRTADRRQPNGVKTDYFRLKARGIMTLPDGTPLANTAAVHLLPHKRSLDDVSKPMTPMRPIIKPSASSLPSKPVVNEIALQETSAKRKDDIEVLKAKAKAVMAEDNERKQKSKKRYLDDDEVELFANAKRVRDQMDEEIQWMKRERRRTQSRDAS